jgi:predicted PurR-regulated permease PerM
MAAATAWVTTHSHQLIDVLLERTTRFLSGSVTTRLLSGFVSGVMLMVIVPFVAFFFLKEGRRITRGLVEMVPNAYFEMTLNLVHSINRSIGGYIRGQLLAVSVVAFLSVTGLMLLDLPYAIPVGVVAGLANVIPYLGPIIGIASATGVALATASGTAMVVKVVVLFLCIQVVDNVLVQPIVVARSVHLHPLVVLTVVMIGSELWGMVGMLIAVPVTGILKVSAQRVSEGIQGYRITERPPPGGGAPPWSGVSEI